uniref:Uncharacterized protein n=1 Tax=Myripristis murdjan TaxID=586833 RepID=A0A667YK17_9TELE
LVTIFLLPWPPLSPGCHAASMQSDADSQMDDSGPALIVFLEKVKNIVENALANLSDTDHEKFKDQLSNDLDMILNLIKNLTAEPYIYALSDLIKEATAAVHEFIHTEIHSLRTDLENRRINLNTVLWKHVNRILIKVNPIITEYARKHRAGIDALTAKLGPLVMEMITMLLTAQDDTREIMKPIGEALDKLDWSLQDLRTMVETYVAVQLREAITVVEQPGFRSFIHLLNRLSSQGSWGVAGAYPSAHWAEGKETPWTVASPSQG